MEVKSKELYSGKVKKLYTHEASSNTLIMEFSDRATAFNGTKSEFLEGKGSVNNALNAFFMTHLEQNGIPTHFVKTISKNSSEVKKVKIIPLECIVRNYSAGTLCKRLGIYEGIELTPPIYNLCYKSDELGDPQVYESEAISLGWADDVQLQTLKELSLTINKVLLKLFEDANLMLVDFKLEFGIDDQNNIILADEITPDGFRAWDKDSLRILDKDRFRKDLDNVIGSYKELATRFGVSL